MKLGPLARLHQALTPRPRAGFATFWYSAMVYFAADFLWILTDQKCVKSATPLLVHHVVSAVYALLPYAYPNLALKMAYVMTVEARLST